MKKFLLFLFVLLSTEVVLAQTPTTFLVTTAEGVPLYFRVTDVVNKKVEMVDKPGALSPSPSIIHYDKVIIPETVSHNGETYTVDKLGWSSLQYVETDSLFIPDNCKLGFQSFRAIKLKRLIMPKNLTVFPNNCLWNTAGTVDELWINSKLKRIESFSTWAPSSRSIKRLRGFASSNIEEIQNMSFYFSSTSTDLINDLSILPQAIRTIAQGAFFPSGLPLNKLTIPLSMENLGGGNYNISGDVYVSHTTPFTLGNNAFGTQSTLKVHVPVDRSFAFKPEAGWSDYADKIVEELKIGPNGYTSYYLENENFEVPAGCTAYIIKNVTQQGTTNFGKTTDVAIAAGSVIPKQTGFILKGTAGSTVYYRAGLTGVTEVDVTGNLLVGTAVEKEFNDAGYKFYLFGKGAVGQGFYYQTGRDGNSIKLSAHRAGLKLSASGPDFAPAKELIFNFDDATTTGVNTVQPAVEKKNDVIYDLQGRRVTNPSRGIYIVNGKKVVISK